VIGIPCDCTGAFLEQPADQLSAGDGATVQQRKRDTADKEIRRKVRKGYVIGGDLAS
jgi:hypothetical protein